MISTEYSIFEFLNFIKGKSWIVAMSSAQHEVTIAEGLTRSGKRGAPAARVAGCDSYAADLKGFIFFLSSYVKPDGISFGLFMSYLEVAKTLTGIDKEQLKKLNEKYNKKL